MKEYESPYLDPHQSREREPTAWELQLADAIESAFSKGAHDLDSLIRALNASRVRHFTGAVWTTENFTNLMRELGA